MYLYCSEKMCQDLRDADIEAVLILDSAVGCGALLMMFNCLSLTFCQIEHLSVSIL